MTTRKKRPLMVPAVALLLVTMTVSCASTGNFMPLASDETVIGTVQATFVARNTLNGRDALNTQAYITLLEAAQQQYSRNDQGGVPIVIDIRDIVWVAGREVDAQNREYAVTGKVIQAD